MNPLATVLKNRGWSTEGLARASTVSQPTCWRAVAGKYRPRLRNRLLIAGALGQPVETLFPDPNNDNGPD